MYNTLACGKYIVSGSNLILVTRGILFQLEVLKGSTLKIYSEIDLVESSDPIYSVVVGGYSTSGEIYNYKNLEEIMICTNEYIPDFTKFQYLHSVNLSYSKIVCVKNLIHIKNLNLHKTQISDVSCLINTEQLDISYTKVTELKCLNSINIINISGLKISNLSNVIHAKEIILTESDIPSINTSCITILKLLFPYKKHEVFNIPILFNPEEFSIKLIKL